MHDRPGANGAIQSVLFDIDGTLVDSNVAHTRAWVDAFAEFETPVDFNRIRPLIGMGSDKLLQALDTGIVADSETGKALTQRRKTIFMDRYLPGVKAFAGAADLVRTMKAAHLRCIVASSASPEELQPLLAIADVSGLFDHAVKPDETQASKPDPDVVAAALAWSEVRPDNAIMIGDTSYDIDAAHRAGVRCIALRCGGAANATLDKADAIFDTPAALVAALETRGVDALLPAYSPKV